MDKAERPPRVVCDECERLREESIRIGSEYFAANDELRQTPKSSSEYHRRVRYAKKANSRWLHAGDIWEQHERNNQHGLSSKSITGDEN
jgi:hypothetical protein